MFEGRNTMNTVVTIILSPNLPENKAKIIKKIYINSREKFERPWSLSPLFSKETKKTQIIDILLPLLRLSKCKTKFIYSIKNYNKEIYINIQKKNTAIISKIEKKNDCFSTKSFFSFQCDQKKFSWWADGN